MFDIQKQHFNKKISSGFPAANADAIYAINFTNLFSNNMIGFYAVNCTTGGRKEKQQLLLFQSFGVLRLFLLTVSIHLLILLVKHYLFSKRLQVDEGVLIYCFSSFPCCSMFTFYIYQVIIFIRQTVVNL
ncbi:hypothetical protein BCV71DRAFT_271360 [Rhizopus microsporus]|uniref:Uncharacterized protein n=1 Tax=Rhizopus microsporus TaxID=58291 RepID=A0A1X0RXA3_RHIZD|nr:hypothetical protein BCV71DRAFT_271360 [Rhizopus microsporus]